MEPIDYVRIFRRRWPTIILIAALGLAVAWFTTPAHPRRSGHSYQATSILLLSPNAPSGTPSLAQAALLVTTGTVPKQVAAQLHYSGDPAQLATQVTATADATVNVLRISSTSSSSAYAGVVANTFSDQLIAVLNQQATGTYQAQVNQVQDQLNKYQAQETQLDAQISRSPTDQVLLAQRDATVNQYRLAYDQFQQLAATGPPQPAFSAVQRAVPVAVTDSSFRGPSSRLARSAIGLIAGLILGAGLILLLERLDLRIRTKEQAEESFGRPVIAEVPPLPRRRRRRKELVTVTRAGSPFAEAHRLLRTLLLFARSGAPGTANGNGNGGHHQESAPSSDADVILVTSAGPSEGKTTTTAHLACAMAEAGRSVLVLSCDFRRPRIHRMFDVPEGLGLTDVLSTDGLNLADVVIDTNVRGVRLVRSGSFVANPAELIAGGHDFLGQARQMADIVLIDTAPVLVANDASEIMPVVDNVLVVSRSGKTSRGSAQRASDLLERVGAKVAGVVLVAAPEAPTNHRYYYYRYYIRQDGPLGWRRLLHRRTDGPLIVPPRAIPRGTPHEDVSQPHAPVEASVPSGSPPIPAKSTGPSTAQGAGRSPRRWLGRGE